MNQIELGTKLYHYLTLRGVGTYEVIGIDGEFILAKSLVCGKQIKEPCIVKLNRVDGTKTQWKYVSMIHSCGQDTYENNDGELISNEYMWHNDSNYYERKADCKRARGQLIISENNNRITKLKEEINKLQQRIIKEEEANKNIELWINDVDVTD